MALVKVVRANEVSSDVYGENQVTKYKKLQKRYRSELLRC